MLFKLPHFQTSEGINAAEMERITQLSVAEMKARLQKSITYDRGFIDVLGKTIDQLRPCNRLLVNRSHSLLNFEKGSARGQSSSAR